MHGDSSARIMLLSCGFNSWPRRGAVLSIPSSAPHATPNLQKQASSVGDLLNKMAKFPVLMWDNLSQLHNR